MEEYEKRLTRSWSTPLFSHMQKAGLLMTGLIFSQWTHACTL